MEREMFIGIPGVGEYNLFTEEENKQSGVAAVKLEGNSDKKWHMGNDILLDYGPLQMWSPLDAYVCSKRQLNLASPRLYLNKIRTQYIHLPGGMTMQEFKDLVSGVWKELLEEIEKLENQSKNTHQK